MPAGMGLPDQLVVLARCGLLRWRMLSHYRLSYPWWQMGLFMWVMLAERALLIAVILPTQSQG